MRVGKFIVALAAFCLLAACTDWDLKELKRAKFKGNAYQTALAKEYRTYSDAEAKRYDWWSSQHFARKGLLAAYGHNVNPEDPANWDIPASMKPELSEARQKLMAALGAPAAAENPEIAASAVAKYDCWLENLKDGWQSEEIDSCRARFFDDLATLEQDALGGPTVEYTIYFNMNSASLDEKGKQIIASVVRDIGDPSGDYEVIVNGHTDRVGSNEYNLKLGMKRAGIVKKALVENGLQEGKVNLFSFGETDPLVKTEDGVQEQKNRRVEIYLSE